LLNKLNILTSANQYDTAKHLGPSRQIQRNSHHSPSRAQGPNKRDKSPNLSEAPIAQNKASSTNPFGESFDDSPKKKTANPFGEELEEEYDESLNPFA